MNGLKSAFSSEVVKLALESDNFEIVKYCPDLKGQVLELQKHFWSRDLSLNAAYLTWKYEHNPYMDTPLIYTVFCGTELVGMMGVYGAKWQIGKPSQTWLGPGIGDFVIHPDHRNRGLYQKLMAFVLDDLSNTDYPYVFDFGGGEVGLSMLMRGWRKIDYLQTAHWQAPRDTNTSRDRRSEPQPSLAASMHRRVRAYAHGLPLLSSAYRRSRKYARKVFLRRAGKLDRSFKHLDSSGPWPHRGTTPHISILPTPRPAAMADLVERVRSDGRMRQVKDEQFFTWRFQNPLSQFRFLFWDDARLEGYLVLQAPVYAYDGKARGNVVDWEATDVQVWADLLQAAIDWGQFDKLTIWSATLSDKAKALLQTMGFNFVNKTRRIARDIDLPTILTRPVRQEMLKTDWVVADCHLLDLTNWDLRMIFSDDF